MIRLPKKTIKHSYYKNQGCLEKKVLNLNKGFKKSNFLREKLNVDI